jgi:hypothetical protein
MNDPQIQGITQTSSPSLAPVSGSVRSRPGDLRFALYKAATEYALYIISDDVNYEKAMKVAGDLEAAADAFATRLALNDKAH